MKSIFNFKNVSPGRGADTKQVWHWVRKIQLLALGVLFSLPLAASAADNMLIQGYCGGEKSSPWFQFSSSTVADVHNQLISALMTRVIPIYNTNVAKTQAELAQQGCAGKFTQLPTRTYCQDPLDCKVQIDASIIYVCGGYPSSEPVSGTMAVLAAGCIYGAPTTPPPAPKKKIVLDPGHGLNCAANGERPGAVGYTDFPASDPPAGRLLEDNLTVAIALEAEKQLKDNYKVIMTKRDVNSCPTLAERRRIASEANAKAFVSIHINSAYTTIAGIPTPVLGGLFSGSSGIYHQNAPQAQRFADEISRSVATSIGVNNRGAMTADFAVIKPYVGTQMTAVLLETARLIGNDEKKLHSPSTPRMAADGIRNAIDTIIGKQ